jgi:selenide,water dikinase
MAHDDQCDLLRMADACGCGAKYPAGALRHVLDSLPLRSDPRLVVGPDTLDDAAVFRLDDGTLLVQTVDFFPPVARDPYVYGRIAAANALSDVYAMGGQPRTALALLCLPPHGLPHDAPGAILAGAVAALAEAGALLVGGHTVADPQIKFGLAVTGIVAATAILTNTRCMPGDLLLLTKPLGTGITLMALKADLATAEQEAAAMHSMSRLNASACRFALDHGAHACTDITGFGFIGHASQMAAASGVTLEIAAARLPLLDCVREFARLGLVPGAAYANRDHYGPQVSFGADVPLDLQDVLYDPQTSGGLLIACPSDCDHDGAWPSVIGRVVERIDGCDLVVTMD